MRTLIILPLILCVVRGDSSDKQDVKTKMTTPSLNNIPQGQKYEMIYQPMKIQQQIQHQYQYQAIPQLQQHRQYVPVQIVPKYFLPQVQPQVQPQAMIIVAQPALLPQSLLYGNPTQQLLHYFQNNPHAKYQLLQGNYQHPSIQHIQPSTYMHQVVGAPSLGNYIFTPAPEAQYQQVAQASPIPAPQPAQQQPQPQQLSHIAQLTQLAAQQYLSSPTKNIAPIVTGFENFTPEQQQQIKSQLSTHLGTNFHAVSNNANNQYSAKYVEQDNSNNFVPSPQLKPESVSTVSSRGDIYKTHRFLAKPKN